MLARHLLIVSVLLLATVSCSDDTDAPDESRPGDAPIPAGVQHSGDFFLVTTDYSPPTPDEFIAGVGVTGVVAVSPEGCLLSEQPEQPERNRRVLMFPADAVLIVEDGQPVIIVGEKSLRVGNGYEGGRRAPYSDESLEEAHPALAALLPEPCRGYPVAVVDEVVHVYRGACTQIECRD